MRESGRHRRKLTQWEAGQVLVDLYDRLKDGREELLNDGHPELATVVLECCDQLSVALELHGSHKFGLGRSK